MTPMEDNNMAKTLKEQYPEGLVRTIVEFEKAFFKICTTDEIDKIIAASDDEDASQLAAIRDETRKHCKDYLDCNWLMAMQYCTDKLLRDIIVYMVMADTEIIPPEQL